MIIAPKGDVPNKVDFGGGAVGVTSSDPEQLADAIRRIADGVQRLKRSGLNTDAIIVLLVHETRLGRKTVRQVLDALASLAKRYTT